MNRDPKTRYPMDVVILSPVMPFDADTVLEKSLGGSESAAYYLAKGLAARGHHVRVFTNQQDPRSGDGVDYQWAGNQTQAAPLGDKFEFYAARTPHDVLLVQRVPMAFHKKWAAKVCVHQHHDLALHRFTSSVNEGGWQVDAFTCVSEWHKKQFCSVYGIDPKCVHVVENGVDPSLYTAEFRDVEVSRRADLPMVGANVRSSETLLNIPPDKFAMLYQSRPERGLEHLVRPGGIMARLAHENPQAHLFVCGYDNTTSQMSAYYQQLDAWAKLLPNATQLGALSKPTLAALQQACDLLCYPTEFEEVSCITAMEAMHAGLPMLTSSVAALPETCAESGTVLLNPRDDKVDEDAFVRWLVKNGHRDSEKVKGLRQRQLQAADRHTWDRVTEYFEAMCLELFNRRKTAGAMQRHLLDHSDISAYDQFVAKGSVEEFDEITAVCGAERSDLYRFIDSPEEYRAHYDHHQKAYYDSNPHLTTEGEDVTGSARFQGTMMLVDRALAEQRRERSRSKEAHARRVEDYQRALTDIEVDATLGNFDELDDPGEFVERPIRVLDFGSAHGHYTIPLAVRHQDVEWVGLDISPYAVNAGARWAAREKLANASFVVGSQADLKDLEGTFDLIIAAEILEHVYDYRGLLKDLSAKLSPGGQLVLTTPVGRWEWSGLDGPSYWKGREHVHHFERRDLLDIFGSQLKPGDLTFAYASQDRAGGVLGSWVYLVTPEVPEQTKLVYLDGEEFATTNFQAQFGEPDYTRKFALTAPRQTVSACLIVKDGEKDLRRCLSAIALGVDEVVVAVDPATTDRTKDIVQQLAQDYPYRAIRTISGLKALDPETGGFGGARNRSVAEACGDWVLWLDADEELMPVFNLWKYLKNSAALGLGLAQLHYSAFPAQVLTTDHPTRLYRNHTDIEFFGLVHEHPELETGKGVPYAYLRPDVQLLHSGYVDEPTRRRRFLRNYPLLQRDLKENPHRKLNAFLYLRDVAQSLMFSIEQNGGYQVAGQRERALEGVKLFEQVVSWGMPRMICDGVQYYSLCVELAHGGFDAQFSIKTNRQDLPTLAGDLSVSGRFHSRAFFNTVVDKLTEELTKRYEDKYA